MSEEIKVNTEIEQALKQFETQSEKTDSYKAVKFYNEPATPKMIQFIMQYSGGAIKSQKTAEYVLLGFVILALGVSFYLLFGQEHIVQKSTNLNLEQTRKVHEKISEQ